MPLPKFTNCISSGIFSAILRWCQQCDILTENRGRIVAVNLFGAAVPIGDYTVERHADDAIFRGIDDGGQSPAASSAMARRFRNSTTELLPTNQATPLAIAVITVIQNKLLSSS
jgi:hypothetical protein